MDIHNLIDTNLPDNTTGEITPEKHREVEKALADRDIIVIGGHSGLIQANEIIEIVHTAFPDAEGKRLPYALIEDLGASQQINFDGAAGNGQAQQMGSVVDGDLNTYGITMRTGNSQSGYVQPFVQVVKNTAFTIDKIHIIEYANAQSNFTVPEFVIEYLDSSTTTFKPLGTFPSSLTPDNPHGNKTVISLNQQITTTSLRISGTPHFGGNMWIVKEIFGTLSQQLKYFSPMENFRIKSDTITEFVNPKNYPIKANINILKSKV